MELDEFISKMTSMINRNKTKQLIQDVIMIYEESYESYDNYVETMKIINNKRTKENPLNACNFSVSVNYQPTHEIIEEWEYDFLIELRKLYK